MNVYSSFTWNAILLPGSRFKRSVAGASQRRLGFEPRPVYVRFIADKVLVFSPVSINHQFSTLLIHMLLLQEGQTGEAWEPPKKRHSFRNWAALEWKVISLLKVSATSPAVETCPNGTDYIYNNGRNVLPSDRVHKKLVGALKSNSYFMYCRK
jgi:hypothetical protein